MLTYQPIRHHWAIQWSELGVFLGAAVALSGFCTWWFVAGSSESEPDSDAATRSSIWHCHAPQGSATLWCMGEAETRRSQLLRGVLDICLLAVMSEGPAYGYEMTKRLRARGLSTVGEGSIYPLLARLERDGLVETRRAASNGGPPRKYYSLSQTGEGALEAGRREWQMARDAVDGVLGLVTTEVRP